MTTRIDCSTVDCETLIRIIQGRFTDSERRRLRVPEGSDAEKRLRRLALQVHVVCCTFRPVPAPVPDGPAGPSLAAGALVLTGPGGSWVAGEATAGGLTGVGLAPGLLLAAAVLAVTALINAGLKLPPNPRLCILDPRFHFTSASPMLGPLGAPPGTLPLVDFEDPSRQLCFYLCGPTGIQVVRRVGFGFPCPPAFVL
jgi:hypothetical protein